MCQKGAVLQPWLLGGSQHCPCLLPCQGQAGPTFSRSIDRGRGTHGNNSSSIGLGKGIQVQFSYALLILNANKVLQQQSVDHCMPCETLPGGPALSRMLLHLGEHWPFCTEFLHSLNIAQSYISTSKYDKNWQ